MAGKWVHFNSIRTAQRAGDEADEDEAMSARAETDSKGRFSIKILKGQRGLLTGRMYTFLGEFENCPKLDDIVKEFGKDVPEVKTPAVEIFAQNNLYGLVVKYPFPGCKKAKID